VNSKSEFSSHARPTMQLSLSSKSNEVVIALLPCPPEAIWSTLDSVGSVLMAALQLGRGGSIERVPIHHSNKAMSSKGLIAEGNVELRRIRGASLFAYMKAAKRAASEGCTMLMLTKGASYVDATGLSAPELALQHPHAFRAFPLMLEESEAVLKASRPCHVIIPLARPPVLQDMCEPLRRCLERFYQRADVAGCSSREVLEPATAAFERLRGAMLTYLERERGQMAPYPIPLALLYHDLEWHRTEVSLGSILQALPEAQLMRFGDNLLLPLSNTFLTSTMIPMLKTFANLHPDRCVGMRGRGKHRTPTKFCNIPIVEFFSWTWVNALGDAALPTATRDRLNLYHARLGDLSMYEGYLGKWFVYFPHVFRLRNEDGIMTVSFWWNSHLTD
jgi:hypothetical protein